MYAKHAKARAKLFRQLKSFKFADAQCFDDRDRGR